MSGEFDDQASTRGEPASASEASLQDVYSLQAQIWRSERRSILEDLVGERPTWRQDAHVLLDVIQHEIGLRRQSGESPELAEYVARFPEHAEALRIQWLINDVFSLGTPAGADEPSRREGLFFIDRFEVRERLGHGGCGVVYRAWDPRLKRTVAIKLLRAGMRASEQDLARFQIEAEAIARVRHRHVVQVYDVGRANGEPYLTMEYCDQGSLADRLDGRPCDPQVAARFMLQVAEAVAAAHDMRVVHRDLKPGNIFLTAPEGSDSSTWPQTEDATLAGSPAASKLLRDATDKQDLGRLHAKVSDFGLAKMLDADEDQTRTGMILGTPMYMAPEQASGRTSAVGPAVDVHAIGAILYELLTGRPPFRGATPIETLDLVRSRDPVAPRVLRPNTPRDLETIVFRCLQKEPTRRYDSAATLADDLRRFLDGQPIRARQIGPLERSWRWMRRNPRTSGLVASIALLLVVLAVGSTLSAVYLKRQRDLAVEAERERRHELYRAYLLESKTNRATNQAGARARSLQAIRAILQTIPGEELGPERTAELRDEAIASLSRSDLTTIGQRSVRTELPYDVDVDPNFEQVAHFSAAGGTQIASVASEDDPPLLGELRSASPSGARPLRVWRRFSPQGRWMLEFQESETETVARVWDCERRDWRPSRSFSARLERCCFDERDRAYCLGSDDTIRVLELPSCDLAAQSPPRFDDARLAVSPDGDQIVVVSHLDQPPLLVDTRTWQTVASLDEAGRCFAGEWLPQFGAFIFANARGQLYVCNPRTLRGFVLVEQHQSDVDNLVVSPNGLYLATNDRMGATIVRSYLTGRVVANLHGFACRFDATSTRLAMTADQQLTVYRIDGFRECASVRGMVDGCQFSPDGRWLFTGGYVGPNVYDVQDFSRIDHEQFALDTCGPVSLSPDGRELVTFGVFSKVHRWPLRPENDDGSRWIIGPARPVSFEPLQGMHELLPQHRGRMTVWTRDGRTIVAADFRNRRVLAIEAAGERLPRVIGELRNVERVAVSPDGKWVAGAAEIYPQVNVWSLAGDAPGCEIPGGMQIDFSDDGRLLAVMSGDRVRLLETGTWRTVREWSLDEPNYLGSPVVFRPGSRRLAFQTSTGVVRLCDVATGATLANLTHPDSLLLHQLAFSPDATRLAYVSRLNDFVGIWNLSELQSGLDELKLQVDPLVERATDRSRPPAPPTRLVIERGDDLPDREHWSEDWFRMADHEVRKGRPSDAVGNAERAIGQLPFAASRERFAVALARRAEYHRLNANLSAARSDWKQALQAAPHLAEAAVPLARSYLYGPAAQQDPARALALLAPLVFRPEPPPEAVFLLAVALYRGEQWRDASATVWRVRDPDWEVVAGYLEAMCQRQLGRLDAVDVTFERARVRHEARRSLASPEMQARFDEAYEEASETLYAGLARLPGSSAPDSAEMPGHAPSARDAPDSARGTDRAARD